MAKFLRLTSLILVAVEDRILGMHYAGYILRVATKSTATTIIISVIATECGAYFAGK